MSRQRRIRYGVDQDTGLVCSELMGSSEKENIAFPVLDFAGMTHKNGYEIKYFLEKMSPFHVHPHCHIVWTRKIPVEIKNKHREFWGMKPLKTS